MAKRWTTRTSQLLEAARRAAEHAGIDAWWPDEGDWFNLFERIKRHQLYYQGPLSTRPNVRPWSLHRNGHLGVAQWGGWVWSGDTMSTWKTLEGQVAVGDQPLAQPQPVLGLRHRRLLHRPRELTGELYARWFQFSAFCPSFRSHGRIWRLRTPWGWGLADMGFIEGQNDPPPQSAMNNPAIEPICRKYAELRYRLIPYTYTLAAEARDPGLPLMRAHVAALSGRREGPRPGHRNISGAATCSSPRSSPRARPRARSICPPATGTTGGPAKKPPAARRSPARSIWKRCRSTSAPARSSPSIRVRQYMSQQVTEPTTIRVYAGADGEFRWYEDDGASQEYLQGKFAWTRLNWNDAARRLTIERDAAAGTLALPSRTLEYRSFSLRQANRGDLRRPGGRKSAFEGMAIPSVFSRTAVLAVTAIVERLYGETCRLSVMAHYAAPTAAATGNHVRSVHA